MFKKAFLFLFSALWYLYIPKSRMIMQNTIVNAMIGRVVESSLGLIVTYKIDTTWNTAYIANKFFKEKIALRIDETIPISPQMSIVLKDGKVYRVKLYLSNNQSNMTYRYASLLSNAQKERFGSEELEMEF